MKRFLLLPLMLTLVAGCGDESHAPRASRGIPASINRPDFSGTPHGQDMMPPGHDFAAAHAGMAGAMPGGMPGAMASLSRPPAGDYGTGPDVRLDAIRLTAAPAWKRTTPRSSFVLAEFAMPAADKDSTDGRLTVTTAGGSVEANIERWKSQFTGKVEGPAPQKFEAASLPVTLVDFSGEFGDQPAPFAPPVNKPGYRMIAAVIGSGEQLYFVKAVGPQATIAAQAEAIMTFIRTLKRTS